jgi:hypothetical protein
VLEVTEDLAHDPQLAAAQAADDEFLAMLDRWDLHNIEGKKYPYPEDVAAAMREGVPPVEMTTEGWLVAKELHWVHADAESWKTWVALLLALGLLNAGRRVVWFDEELGLKVLAERLTALGADPAVVERGFAYFPFPSWEMTPEHVAGHAELLKRIRPALVVYDTATDCLTAASLDENSGPDVTRWVKAYPEQARRLDITQLVLDHTGKDAGRGAVGSRAKRAKAKVQYLFKTEKRGDAETVGEVRITLEKNTRGARIPGDRLFRIGGGDNEPGGFTFEEIEDHTAAEKKQRGRTKIRERIERALQEHGPLTQTNLADLVSGKKADVIAVAKELADNPLVYGVRSRPDGRSIVYEWVGTTDLEEGEAAE